MDEEAEPRLSLLVRQVRYEAEGVVSLELCRRDGGPLPTWRAGSHIDVVLPSGLVRQYSLCGDLSDRTAWRIAVLREAESRGGSAELHERALVGTELEVRGPRNRFALVTSPSYLFVAGGIGITPILPMLEETERAGARWRLVYGGRRRTHMAFLEEVSARRSGEVTVLCEDEDGMPDLERLVAEHADGLIYACGPPAMLAALEHLCIAAGVELHLERFTVAPDLAPSGLGTTEDEPFEVELARSNTVLVVPPGETLLRCVRRVVPAVLFSCEEGYCGTCETRVLAGEPEHRDSVLSAEEREKSETMMICVGRSRSARLVLDL